MEAQLGDRPAAALVAFRVSEPGEIATVARNEVPRHPGHPAIQSVSDRAADHDEVWSSHSWRLTEVTRLRCMFPPGKA